MQRTFLGRKSDCHIFLDKKAQNIFSSIKLNTLAIDLFAGKRNFTIKVKVQNNTLMIIFITLYFDNISKD